MIVRAIVSNANDPSGKGRIKVTVPSQSGAGPGDWIWPCISGGYFVKPRPGAQVWVVFENGDKDTPVWLGATKEDPAYDDLLARISDLEDRVTALEP